MPIYEYECKKCGHFAEALQKFSDQPLTKCEACGGKLRKLISQTTFHLKGTGWYVTDYASKSTSHSGGNKDKGTESGKGDSGSNSKDTSTSTKESKETPTKKDNSEKKQ
jgi:putative FmdB family regulatory protein